MKRLLPLAFASLVALPAGADCRLALALAMDVSRSVDAADFVIQTEGLAAALEDEAVRQAFFAPAGDVALAVLQWSGETHQDLLQDWVMIRSDAELDAVAAMLRGLRYPDLNQLTALGAALDFGRELLGTAPDCGRRVLDMAGDGRNNAGPSVARVFKARGWDGITVNALAISEHEMELVDYLQREVIRGPGAFVVLAPQQVDFPPAIRRKLLRELTEALSGLETAPMGGKS